MENFNPKSTINLPKGEKMIQLASYNTDIMVEEHIKEIIVRRCFPVKDTKKHIIKTMTITTKTALMQTEYRVESKEEEEKCEGNEDNKKNLSGDIQANSTALSQSSLLLDWSGPRSPSAHAFEEASQRTRLTPRPRPKSMKSTPAFANWRHGREKVIAIIDDSLALYKHLSHYDY